SPARLGEVTAGPARSAAGLEWSLSTNRHQADAMQVEAAEAALQCDILRDMVRHPHSAFYLEPVWLTPIMSNLAQAAYDERLLPSGELDRVRLAILADALEEAGAPDELLAHLRSPGLHFRGCWAADLCLGLT